MDTLTYLTARFNLRLHQRSPIEIPNVGRDDLARVFHPLEFRRGVEVGVERGLYSEVLCRENPGVELFAVDAWTAYRGYRDHVSQEKLDRFHSEATERLKPYPHAQLVRQFSVEAAKAFKDGSLDFVYLDGNHCFEQVVADLAAWSPKVREGGILAGHDYVRHRLPDRIAVLQAVNGWTDAYEIEPWFLLGSQAKVAGQVRDEARSWFWVQTPRTESHPPTRPIRH